MAKLIPLKMVQCNLPLQWLWLKHAGPGVCQVTEQSTIRLSEIKHSQNAAQPPVVLDLEQCVAKLKWLKKRQTTIRSWGAVSF